jgi:hypothetical protein
MRRFFTNKSVAQLTENKTYSTCKHAKWVFNWFPYELFLRRARLRFNGRFHLPPTSRIRKADTGRWHTFRPKSCRFFVRS